jgi:hypothetical protein
MFWFQGVVRRFPLTDTFCSALSLEIAIDSLTRITEG